MLNVQEFGHPDGRPIAVLHGGPGSGASAVLRRGFDRQPWRVICIDQRGAGASRPAGGLDANTTDDLLDDLRRVRGVLGLPRWAVAGGSWGSTLAVAYAAFEPDAVTGLLLRASFLGRREDIDAFFARPDDPALQPLWDACAQVFGEPMLPALAEALCHGGPAGQQAAAQAWHRWERALGEGVLGEGVLGAPSLTGDALARQVQRLRIQAHYLVHDCWLAERPLLARCAQVPPVPVALIHARDDRVCPPAGALALQAALPGSTLEWLPASGHDAAHPAVAEATARAAQRLWDTAGPA